MTMHEAAQFLLTHDDYLILTHRRPDGDTSGSAAGLCRALRACGKTAHIYPNPQFTPRLLPYLEGLMAGTPLCYKSIVSVDAAADDTLCLELPEEIAGNIDLAIDHHAGHRITAREHLVDAKAAACAEVIFALIGKMGIKLDSDIATALYIGISTDTGCFRFANVTASTLRIAAELLQAGAKTAQINKVFFDTKSISRLRLESRLTESVELLAGGAVGICRLPKAWMEELHITEDDIDSISGFVRSIEGVRIGIMIREVEGGMGKISLRTEPGFDANAYCRELGGGGHAAAAGCSVEGGIEAAYDAILGVLRRNGVNV